MINEIVFSRRDFVKCSIFCFSSAFVFPISIAYGGPYYVTVSYFCCSGCELCVDSCPQEVFEMQYGKAIPVFESECVGCLECCQVCAEQAISVTNSANVKKIQKYNELSYKQIYNKFEDLYNRFAGKIYNETGILFGKISPRSYFIRELRLNLYHQFDVMCEIEKEFDVIFSEEEVRSLKIVKDVVDLIAKKHNIKV